MGNRHAEGRDTVNPRFAPFLDLERFPDGWRYSATCTPVVDIEITAHGGATLLSLRQSILPPLEPSITPDNPPPEYSIPKETERFLDELLADPKQPIQLALRGDSPVASIRVEHGRAWGNRVIDGLLEKLFESGALPRFEYTLKWLGRRKRYSILEVDLPSRSGAVSAADPALPPAPNIFVSAYRWLSGKW